MRRENVDYLKERIDRKNLDVISMVSFDDVDDSDGWSKASCQELAEELKYLINEYKGQYKTQVFIEREVKKLEKYIASHF